jgi:hypothetical protein
MKYSLEYQRTINIDKLTEDDNIAIFWYDWVCKTSSLKNKTIKLMKQVVWFCDNILEIDDNETFVLFKNNYPVNGNLYDNFRICNDKQNIPLFTFFPSHGHKNIKDKAQLWSIINDFKEPLFKASDLRKLKKLLLENNNYINTELKKYL